MNNIPSVAIEISVDQVKQVIDSQEDFLLIDCRETNEYEMCRIDGSVLIPMNETANRLEEIEPYRQKRVVVHCHHGGRSMRVVQWLREQGFEQSQNMAGGIDAWSNEIDPTVAKY